MNDEMTFTLHSPLTEEEWDMIVDVDLDHTQEITFHTKHGKEVVFVKRKKGQRNHGLCSVCGYDWGKDAPVANVPPFCPNCGCDMQKGKKDATD